MRNEGEHEGDMNENMSAQVDIKVSETRDTIERDLFGIRRRTSGLTWLLLRLIRINHSSASGCGGHGVVGVASCANNVACGPSLRFIDL